MNPLAAACADPAFLAFFTERHLATLVTLRPDGTPHVVPVGVTIDPAAGTAWVICSASSTKARNAAAGTPAAISQVDGRRWATLEGRAAVHTAADTILAAVARYATRYRPPRPNPTRVVLELTITKVLADSTLRP
jgi:PPOX class probable F420-dependent enzyme